MRASTISGRVEPGALRNVSPLLDGICRCLRRDDSRAAGRDRDPCRPRRASWRSRPGRQISRPECRSQTSPERQYRLPRISDPKMMTRFCSPRSLSRSAIHASRLCLVARRARPRLHRRPPETPQLAFRARRNLREARRLPPQLDDCELITYSFARCSRTLLRICHASSGCCSVGSLPISRIAGALKTSRMLAVASGLPRKRRRESREVRRAVMVDVVRLQHHSRKLLQQIIFFVGGAVRANHANRLRRRPCRELPQTSFRSAQTPLPRSPASACPFLRISGCVRRSS